MSFFTGFTFSSETLAKHDLEQVLDHLEMTRVNKIMFIAQDPWGSDFTPDPERYTFTKFKPSKSFYAKSTGKDALALVCEAANKRGMQVYAHDLAYECSTLGYWPATSDRSNMSDWILKNFTAAAQIDIFGRKSFRVCTNNPDYRQFYLSIIEDQLRNYPIEGIKFNLERNGPLSSVLVGNYAGSFHYRKPLAPVCFCPHCIAEAKSRGINIDRAKQGWIELLEFSERSLRQAKKEGNSFVGDGPMLGKTKQDTAPSDGYFITFLRIIMRFPEILQWNQMWYDSLLSLMAEAYGVVKLVGPDRKLGLHIWHHRDFSIFERAMFDYSEIKRYADWIKPKMDHTCAGFRYHQDVKRYTQALFYDRDQEKAYEAWNTMLGWDNELPYEQLPEGGMSLEYLKRNVRTAVDAVNDEVPIYPGMGINMPSPKRDYTEEIIQTGLKTVYEAGARGVLIARNYLEMDPKLMAAAGRAIDEINADIRRKETK
jgi:hypothetical protein